VGGEPSILPNYGDRCPSSPRHLGATRRLRVCNLEFVQTHEDFDSDEFVPPDLDDTDETTSPGPRVAVDVAAFACELGMLVLLAFAGFGLGDGGLMGIALAAFYPALVVVIWSFWVAPKATRRLRDPWRLVLQVVLFAATGVASGLAGYLVAAIVFPIIASLVFIATRFVTGVAQP
jgi:hypothetical protein